MASEMHNGFMLINNISVFGQSYYLGVRATGKEDLSAPPFATWSLGSDGSYTDDRYFTDIDSASVDLVKRSFEALPEQQRSTMISETMPESYRAELSRQLREEACLEDIHSCLCDALTNFDLNESVADELLNNDKFRAHAIHIYYRQDHSYENEALQESLETLLKEQYMDLLPTTYIIPLKISPEEMALQNDILSLTADEIEAKYGDFEPGESVLRFELNIPSPFGSRDMCISIFPKEHDKDKNMVSVELYSPSNLEEPTVDLILKNVENLEQVFSLKDDNGITWGIDLHADERLRRIGREFIFRTETATDIKEYAEHDGEECTVVRLAGKGETDLSAGLMWEVQFKDGIKLYAWDSELCLDKQILIDLENNPEQQKPIIKSSLDNLISKAHAAKDDIASCENPHQIEAER